MTSLIDLGEYGAEFTDNPHALYAELRGKGPVHQVRLPAPLEHETAWLVVGYEEARAALADPRLSKDDSSRHSPGSHGPAASDGPDGPGDAQRVGRNMLLCDPPRHTRLRRLIAREFTGRRVEALLPRVKQVTDELLDAMLAGGSSGDLVGSLAFPLPMTVICELLGVPELHRAEFRRLSNECVAPTGAASHEAAVIGLTALLEELIEDKSGTGAGDDLFSDLARTAAEDGDRLSAGELQAMAFLLLVAGHETTVNLIANGVQALLAHPDQLAALRADMTLLDGAVEEMLRYEGPVENATYRYAAEPLDIGGTRIPQDEWVLIGLTAADRDPVRYPEPDRFDIRRAPQGHLAFGHGIHFCLGAPLARAEARIAIRALLERCPGLAFDGTPGPWLPGVLIRGVRSLPVRW